MSTQPFPANRVRIKRLYQADCAWCPWKGTIAEHPHGRLIANNEKRIHVAEHRAGQHRPEVS